MNGADFRSELTLPSHPDAIVLAGAYARALATLAGLAPTELDALVDAVTTACADIVQNALAPGEVDALALVEPRQGRHGAVAHQAAPAPRRHAAAVRPRADALPRGGAARAAADV